MDMLQFVSKYDFHIGHEKTESKIYNVELWDGGSTEPLELQDYYYELDHDPVVDDVLSDLKLDFEELSLIVSGGINYFTKLTRERKFSVLQMCELVTTKHDKSIKFINIFGREVYEELINVCSDEGN